MLNKKFDSVRIGAIIAPMLPAQPNQSLIDGLACLQALATAGGPVGSRQLGRELGLESTRVNRLLKTLAHLGIAQQTADRQYTPGPAMHVLAAQAMFGSGLLQRAIGPLESLRRAKMSVAMGVLWRDHVSYLYHAGPTMKPAEALGRVGLFPATRSSIGMMLLARRPVDEVRALYRGAEIPNFPDGIESLLKQLAVVRRSGVAIVQPFERDTVRTIAVAIEAESAAIAFSGPIARGDEDSLTVSLREAAAQIAKPQFVENV
ncbi:global regulatory protein [soil metagenome]